MNTSPLVSVVLPFFNNEGTLSRAIDSVLQQSYKRIELILIDDGSTDNSSEIAQIRLKQDDRIKLIAIDVNSGRSHARNVGISGATGVYISFLDADDFYCHNKIDIQVDCVLSGKYDIVFSSYFMINYDHAVCKIRQIPVQIPMPVLENFVVSNPVGFSTALVDRNVIGDCFFLPGRKEDLKFWYCLAEKGCSFYGISDCLVYYHSLDFFSLMKKKISLLPAQYSYYREFLGMGVVSSLFFLLKHVSLSFSKYRGNL